MKEPISNTSKKLVISIVSHGHGMLIEKLLCDLNNHLVNSKLNIKIVITLNVPEDEGFLLGHSNLSIRVIRNKSKKGFGKNNNYAFNTFKSDFFLVLNPDVRIKYNLIDPMIEYFSPDIALIAPKVLSSDGVLQDNFRKFPTILRLIKRKIILSKKSDYNVSSMDFHPVDWVGGMFMLFNSEKYIKVRGFDERYFMYLEDADICKRLLEIGFSTIYTPSFEIIHDPRHASRKELRYFLWHVRSMARFLFKI